MPGGCLSELNLDDHQSWKTFSIHLLQAVAATIWTWHYKLALSRNVRLSGQGLFHRDMKAMSAHAKTV
jgi:hypothetical protein